MQQHPYPIGIDEVGRIAYRAIEQGALGHQNRTRTQDDASGAKRCGGSGSGPEAAPGRRDRVMRQAGLSAVLTVFLTAAGLSVVGVSGSAPLS